MSKDIWHTTDKTPKSYENIAFYVDGYLYSSYYEPQYNQYGIFSADKVKKWCYFKDLSLYILALETENKDISDKIGKLETELERTRKALEIAIHRLNQIAEHDCDQGCMYVAQNALEQITAIIKGSDNE